jgi:hypothetical protein
MKRAPSYRLTLSPDIAVTVASAAVNEAARRDAILSDNLRRRGKSRHDLNEEQCAAMIRERDLLNAFVRQIATLRSGRPGSAATDRSALTRSAE